MQKSELDDLTRVLARINQLFAAAEVPAEQAVDAADRERFLNVLTEFQEQEGGSEVGGFENGLISTAYALIGERFAKRGLAFSPFQSR